MQKQSDRKKGQNSRYYQTANGRARHLLKQAKRRARDKDQKFTLTLDRIVQALERGKCEVTGIDFWLGSSGDFQNHPLAPSADKIDPRGEYTDENVQIVCQWYNVAKGQSNDEQMLERMLFACDHILRRIHGEPEKPTAEIVDLHDWFYDQDKRSIRSTNLTEDHKLAGQRITRTHATTGAHRIPKAHQRVETL
jgi:hypothetical protein